jgi:large subunit ribosomal protein L19
MDERIKKIEASFMTKKYPDFGVGDTVKVMTKIAEGDKIRLHPFEGLVIGRRGSGIAQNFTVRKVSYGEGTERIFPLYSPEIDSINVVRRGKVRRAKLYYLRRKIGKRATKIEAANDNKEAKEIKEAEAKVARAVKETKVVQEAKEAKAVKAAKKAK